MKKYLVQTQLGPQVLEEADVEALKVIVKDMFPQLSEVKGFQFGPGQEADSHAIVVAGTAWVNEHEFEAALERGITPTVHKTLTVNEESEE